MPRAILKKAQIQMMETIGVLFVFFLLLGFGLIFYAGLQKDSISRVSDDKAELDQVTVAQTISSMPEVKCSEQNSIAENCFDEVSLKVFSEYMKNLNSEERLYFLSLFRSTNITVSIFDDKTDTFEYIPIYYSNEDNLRGTRTNFVPITIKDSRTGQFKFGVLYLTVFT